MKDFIYLQDNNACFLTLGFAGHLTGLFATLLTRFLDTLMGLLDGALARAGGCVFSPRWGGPGSTPSPARGGLRLIKIWELIMISCCVIVVIDAVDASISSLFMSS